MDADTTPKLMTANGDNLGLRTGTGTSSVDVDADAECRCTNCNDALPNGESLKDCRNFHEFLMESDGFSTIQVIDAISKVFRVRRDDNPGRWERIYRRSDLFLCQRCGGIFAELHKLYQQFTELTVASNALLKDLIVDTAEIVQQSVLTSLKVEATYSSSESDGDCLEEGEGIECVSEGVGPIPTNTVRKRGKSNSKRTAKKSRTEGSPVTCSTIEDAQQIQAAIIRKQKRKKAEEPLVLSNGSSTDCDRCDKKFSSNGGLKIHYASHIRDDEKLICKTCGKKFRKEEDLKMHEKVDHEGFKPHKCNLCQKCFRLKDKLKLHVMVIHERKKPFPCPKCEKAFRTKYHLKIHDVTQHIQGSIPSFGCTKCKRRFPDRDALDKHIVIHDEDKKFQCIICNKGFQTATRLKLHEKSHLEVPTCLCPVCGRSYKYIRDLRLHEVVHQDESTYRFGCGDCPRRFYRIDLLRVHQSNEKHFSTEKVGPSISKANPPKNTSTGYEEREFVNETEILGLEIDEEIDVKSELHSTSISPKSRTSKMPSRKSIIIPQKREIIVNSSSIPSQTTVVYHTPNVVQLQLPAIRPSPISVKTPAILGSNSSQSSRLGDFHGSTYFFTSSRDRQQYFQPGIQIHSIQNSEQSQIQFSGHQTNVIATSAMDMPTTRGGESESSNLDLNNSFAIQYSNKQL